MTVKARMTCLELKQGPSSEIHEQQVNGDYGPSGRFEPHFDVRLMANMKPESERTDEDLIFGSATPSADVTMHICNEAAARYFEPGAEYEITFERITSG